MRAARLAIVSALLLCGTALARAQDVEEALFSISVDGQQVAGTPMAPDGNRKADMALEAADIQVKYDGLNAKPFLNAATTSSRRSFAVGEEVEFLASSNYPAYIARREIRIFATGRHAPTTPVAVVEVGTNNLARWTMPEAVDTQGFDDFVYVLRVYDARGRFDETRQRECECANYFEGKTPVDSQPVQRLRDNHLTIIYPTGCGQPLKHEDPPSWWAFAQWDGGDGGN